MMNVNHVKRELVTVVSVKKEVATQAILEIIVKGNIHQLTFKNLIRKQIKVFH